VPVDEIERVEAEPRGDRRARRQRQHHAGQHQRAGGGERELVDGPPPFAEGRALRARDHAVPRPQSKLTRHGLRSINSGSSRSRLPLEKEGRTLERCKSVSGGEVLVQRYSPTPGSHRSPTALSRDKEKKERGTASLKEKRRSPTSAIHA